MEEKESIVGEDVYFNQLAVSSEHSTTEIKKYISHIDDITRALSARLDELDQDNKRLKEEVQRKESEISVLNSELLEEKMRSDSLSQECTRLLERVREIGEKYEKEAKKSNLLEVENNRNLDEIKSLRKERNELLQKVDKDKPGWKDKIRGFISK